MSPNQRIATIAAAIFLADQVTKQAVLKFVNHPDEIVLINGFFKLVNWRNTGAAWSLFSGQNALLAIVSLVALLGLFLWRHHFDTKTTMGQVSLGLIFGGIAGNLCDRLFIHHVIDFLRFYIITRSGEELGFPAFNVADSAICVGVGLLFIVSWQQEPDAKRENSTV